MIDPTAIFHTGLAVTELEAEMTRYRAALGVEWAPIKPYDPLRLWRPEGGWIAVPIRAVYSRYGPHHLELIQGPVGSFYDPATMPHPNHIGLWVDAVGPEVARLAGMGWTLLAAKGEPAQSYGDMAYMRAPGDDLVIELVQTSLRPMLEAWWAAP